MLKKWTNDYRHNEHERKQRRGSRIRQKLDGSDREPLGGKEGFAQTTSSQRRWYTYDFKTSDINTSVAKLYIRK